ncbi:MAG: ribosome recycling factor [Candidatus Izimaplasma sp.]|nr:ribosome recycling factor [Candidatus Izimaplasma bacterium]
MPDMILLETEEQMTDRIDLLKRELSKVRTGRANPALLEQVHVDYYGVETQLSQIGKIAVPEANQLLVKPYDKSMVKDVERAINAANLGLNPNNEGDQLRIVLPALTKERREQLKKDIHKLGEECKIGVRSARHDGRDAIKKLEKNGDISEDDMHEYYDDIQELTNKYVEKADQLIEQKEQDIMTL